MEAGVPLAIAGKAADTAATTSAEKRGKIARYAWGDDYHDVMAAKLDRIDNFLREFGGDAKMLCRYRPGFGTRSCGAGGDWLAWQEHDADRSAPGHLVFSGRNPDHARIAARCSAAGSMRDVRTLHHRLPNRRITAPHRLDARRCISYLTIELKGAIPLELRPLIGNRIFGCDDCLDACPWNRFAEVSRESAFAARKSAIAPSLRDYLKLSDAQFRPCFEIRRSSGSSAAGFLRNVCVALGQCRRSRAICRRWSGRRPIRSR